MGIPPEKISAKPRAIPIIPNVAINGGTFSLVIKIPFANPRIAPKPRVTRIVRKRFPVAAKTIPPTTAEQANTEPTERSIPPEIITKVSPTAIIPMTAVCSVISKIFVTVKN